MLRDLCLAILIEVLKVCNTVEIHYTVTQKGPGRLVWQRLIVAYFVTFQWRVVNVQLYLAVLVVYRLIFIQKVFISGDLFVR